ncbi:MAG: hypothetical protein ACLSH6_02540 [Limosilactobacillus pontis]
MAAAMGDGIMIHNVIPEHLEAFTSKMIEMGVDLQIDSDKIYVPKVTHLKGINVKNLPFPGFATDLQQPFTPLLSLASGDSMIVDTIYPKRVKHVSELQKMGMNIEAHDGTIIVKHMTTCMVPTSRPVRSVLGHPYHCRSDGGWHDGNQQRWQHPARLRPDCLEAEPVARQCCD